MLGDPMPDAAVAGAARDGDAQALDTLVGAYLPLVYNIVGRALDIPAEIDDVVQEVMLQMVRDLRQLRDPGAFRSWLVAIAMRQVRAHWRARRTAPVSDPIEDRELADPGADFVDLTIITLGLSDQRREVAEASRWLDAEDGQLLALWWLEAAGELTRAELAFAMEMTPAQAAVLVHRAKARLEAARTVVRAIRVMEHCHELNAACANWDGGASPLWRKRIVRHVRECSTCGTVELDMVPAERLLAGMSLLPVPAALLAISLTHTRIGAQAATLTSAGHHTARAGSRMAGHWLGLSAAGKAVVATVAAIAVLGAGVVGTRQMAHHQPSAAAVRSSAASPTSTASERSIPPTTTSSRLTPVTSPPTPATSQPAAAAVVDTAFPIRAAFYYPWYPENFQPPGSRYTPSAGSYNVDDPAVVDRQIRDMQYGGLQAGIISWWGRGLREDRRTPLLMAEAAKLGFSWSAYYEKEAYGDPSATEIASDLTYLRKSSDQKSWLHVDGRPVIFVYADGNDGCGMATRWAQANKTAHYYVVLKVFGGYLKCADQPQGWHQYVDSLDVQRGFSAVTSPGFWRYDQSPSVPRDPARFLQDVTTVATSRDPFQLIISYNEWGEGTAVESATAWASPSGHGVYMDILHQVFAAHPR
jgi:RNA polymerase sigma factor (sigma-70 family)